MTGADVTFPRVQQEQSDKGTPLVRALGEAKQLADGLLRRVTGEVPAPEQDWAQTRVGTGMEHPNDVPPGEPLPLLQRTFAFVDLCRFTRFNETHGVHATINVLSRFRVLAREVTARRGVRVAKWMGDGAMIVGVEPGPTVAAVIELIGRFATEDLKVRAGMATGDVLLFEGDDYIGRPANLASRLCNAADPGVVLVDPPTAAAAPDWVHVGGTRSLTLPGLGRISNLVQLNPETLPR